MARDKPNGNRASTDREHPLPHLLTIEGQGTPASYEVTVDGHLELVSGDPTTEIVTISGSSAEGAVEYGQWQFRFSGTLTDVTIRNRGGLSAHGVVDPEVYVQTNQSV